MADQSDLEAILANWAGEAMGRIRILVADDHEAIRFGIRAFCERGQDVQVIGEAGDGARAIVLTRDLRPDVLLLDARLPGRDGVTVVREVRQAVPQTRILIYTGYADDAGLALAFLRLGVQGFLSKPAPLGEVVVAVRRVAEGGRYLDARIAERLLFETPGVESLTPRERDVLRGAAEGMTDHDIRQRLGISHATVRSHLKALFARFGAASRGELAHHAREQGWIP